MCLAHIDFPQCKDKTDVPMIKYNFVELANLGQLEKDAVCGKVYANAPLSKAQRRYVADVIAVIKDVGDLGEITSKATQRTIPKRDINLVDQSGFSCRLTLWGKQAQDFTGNQNAVVAFKAVKVGDFGGM
jgi:replication factor A1